MICHDVPNMCISNDWFSLLIQDGVEFIRWPNHLRAALHCLRRRNKRHKSHGCLGAIRRLCPCELLLPLEVGRGPGWIHSIIWNRKKYSKTCSNLAAKSDLGWTQGPSERYYGILTSKGEIKNDHSCASNATETWIVYIEELARQLCIK